jgi:hypothetical protein
MFRIVGHHPLLKSGHAGIVDHNVSYRDAFCEPQPVGFLPHVELFEPATDLRGGCRTIGFVKIGDDDVATFEVKAGGNRAADTARSAGYDANLVIQSLHDVLKT